MWKKIIISSSILVIAVCFFCACSDTQTAQIKPVYNATLSPNERLMAERAFGVFCETCQPLMGKYSKDIESIEIEKGFDRGDSKIDNGCFDYRCRDYGWDKQIYIKLKLKDRLTVIPGELKAMGHTLHIFMGGPVNPGITIEKFSQLCGVPKPTDGSFDALIPEPKLAFIKK